MCNVVYTFGAACVGDLVLRVGGKEETLVLLVVVVWLLLFCFV